MLSEHRGDEGGVRRIVFDHQDPQRLLALRAGAVPRGLTLHSSVLSAEPAAAIAQLARLLSAQPGARRGRESHDCGSQTAEGRPVLARTGLKCIALLGKVTQFLNASLCPIASVPDCASGVNDNRLPSPRSRSRRRSKRRCWKRWSGTTSRTGQRASFVAPSFAPTRTLSASIPASSFSSSWRVTLTPLTSSRRQKPRRRPTRPGRLAGRRPA